MAKIAGDRSKKRSIYRNGRKGRRGTRKFPPQRAQMAQSNRRWNDYADSQLLRVSVSNSKMQPEATEHHPRPEPSAGGAAELAPSVPEAHNVRRGIRAG